MALLKIQTRVEVRSEFDGAWVGGFEVAEATADPAPAYRVRRRSDRFLLPLLFPAAAVRPAAPPRSRVPG